MPHLPGKKRGMKKRRLIELVVAIMAILPCTGCKFLSAFNDHSTQPSVPVQVIEMPSVTMRDLDATGRRLAEAGLSVVVKRPELAVNAERESSRAAFKLPEITRPFEASRWNHLIAAQDPPPGTSLQPGSVVTLTAGVHHGAGPFRPWLNAHGGSVSVRGEQRCRDCHTPMYCSECHQKVRLPATAQ